MKPMKRILAMTLTLVTVLSFSVFASASDSAPVIVEGENYTIIKQDGPPIMTRDVTWIETTHYTGKSAYSTSITCAEGEGNALNVFIDNTNGNGTLNVIFTIDGQEIAEEDLPLLQLPKGKAQTYTIKHNDKSDLGGSTIDIEIGSNDGHEMDFTIRARQYNYVG